MTRRRILTSALVAWLPVACLLGLTLLAPPGSSEPRVSGSLDFSPRHFYGGQALTFTGSLGHGGKQKIWLELNENRQGDSWVKIEGSTHTTDSSGRFKFQFPARGMNNILVRVASAHTVTPSVLFQADDQAVSLAMRPSDGTLYDGGPCSATFNKFVSYDAVAGEPFQVVVDSTPEGEPVLKGRKVVLERRSADHTWSKVTSTTLDEHGRASFPVTLGPAGPVAYRAVLGDVNEGVNQIGWFPSFPTYVDPLPRSAAVTGAVAAVPPPDPFLGAPHPEKLDLAWALPGGSAVSDVIVAWNNDGSPVANPANADETRTIGPDTGFGVTGLEPATSYDFAVLTRAPDKVCSVPVVTTGQTAPAPLPAPVSAPGSVPQETQVVLSWTLPATTVDGIRVRRSQGNTAPQAPTGSGNGVVVADLDPSATSVSDFDVQPGTTYAYSVFTRSQWGDWSGPVSTIVTTPTPPDPQP